MAARIVIVDDNEANLELVGYLLEAGGHTVLRAEDGEQALALVHQLPRPDLVISDLRMPVMDGFELLSRIRQDATLDGLPVIAVTAFSMAADRTRVMDAGFGGYLSKPIVPESFIGEVEKFLQAGRRHAGSSSGP
ncbi:polar differentiation response regulator [Thauera sp. 28]|uniref:response regulator n=1 Tax=Thauera sp. 28 TaxID=303682 RepID=UPI0002CE2200|nr:response regulator [Thauera sp. 28]ENO94855.1 polar differentiation response regulator [Thauera sp. 28]